MTSRHGFLAALHQILKPKVYLEVGVQHGWSLNLATDAEVAIGIDPAPLVAPHGNQVILAMTSDRYFSDFKNMVSEPIDLAFIDGMHLYEFALRDFYNIEQHAHSEAVVVFDDVLPLTQAMAAREMCPGDWTGDVWKSFYILKELRPDLKVLLVDTSPTGTMLVMNLDPVSYEPWINDIGWTLGDTVPQEVLLRDRAVSPDLALHAVRERFQ